MIHAGRRGPWHMFVFPWLGLMTAGPAISMFGKWPGTLPGDPLIERTMDAPLGADMRVAGAAGRVIVSYFMQR